jgi:flagellar FliJ protein
MQSLRLLMQREQQQRDQAQAALRQAEDAARRASEQCEQLRAYRGEYEERWSAQFNQGGTMDILKCYRSFMQRLDQAVAMQARQAELAAAMCEQARTVLLERARVARAQAAGLAVAEQLQAGRQREKHSDSWPSACAGDCRNAAAWRCIDPYPHPTPPHAEHRTDRRRPTAAGPMT